MRNTGDAAEHRNFKHREDDNQTFSAEIAQTWGKGASKSLSADSSESARQILGSDFSIVDDSSERLPKRLRKANVEYDAGAADLTNARADLKIAKDYIYGKYELPNGDREGRKFLHEARQELREAKQHFKQVDRLTGHGEGDDEIKEGRRDLRKADRLIGKAIRQDRNFNQDKALETIRKAIDQLDGTDGPHAIKEGLGKAIDEGGHHGDSRGKGKRRL